MKFRSQLRRKSLHFTLLVLLTLSFSATTIPAARAAQTPFATGTPDEIVTYIDSLVKNNVTTKPIMTSLIQQLQKPDNDIRIRERAAWALGELGVKRAVPVLIEAAKHKGLLIRSAALEALVRLRDRSALPILIEIASIDPILSLRQRATLGLGLLQWEQTIPHLVTLSSDKTPEVRGAAALAMAATHSKKNDFSHLLAEMAAEEDPYVKRRAQTALDVIERKTTTIKKQLSSEDMDIRLFAAFYFTHHGVSADLSRLKEVSNGEANEEVRHELSRAIGAIKKRAAEAKARKEKAAREAAQKAASPGQPGQTGASSTKGK